MAHCAPELGPLQNYKESCTLPFLAYRGLRRSSSIFEFYQILPWYRPRGLKVRLCRRSVFIDSLQATWNRICTLQSQGLWRSFKYPCSFEALLQTGNLNFDQEFAFADSKVHILTALRCPWTLHRLKVQYFLSSSFIFSSSWVCPFLGRTLTASFSFLLEESKDCHKILVSQIEASCKALASLWWKLICNLVSTES